MQAKTLKAQSLLELQNQIEQFKKEGFQPTLAIIFAAIDIGLENVTNFFSTQKIDLVGCSSAGEIADHKCLQNSVVGLLFDLNRDFYKICSVHAEAKNIYKASFEAGLMAKSSFAKPAMILMSGGIAIDAEQLVFGVRDAIGREIPMFGGQAGDNAQLLKTFAFSNNFISDCGVSTLIIDYEKVDVRGMATSGWESIGNEHTITKCEGNVVFEINDRPALEVFHEYFGFFSNRVEAMDQHITISAQYPLQIARANGESVLRAPLFALPEQNAFVLAGGVKKGEKFKFSIAPGFEIIEKTIEKFNELRLQESTPDAVLLFSCFGRHTAFGPMLEDEVEGLYKHWNAPMAGFMSYGEIGTTELGVCEFHNETCSLVLLKERSN
jgi:hypothetical protein